MIPAVYIVIPVHNRKQKTLDCLETLSHQTYSNITTIVVDDGSDDGTSQAINEHYPYVTVLHGDGNLWWTGGMNYGVSQVLDEATDADFVLSLNDDTLCPVDYVAELVSSADESTLIGSVLVEAGSGRVLDGGVSVNWLTAKLNRTEGMSLTDLQGRDDDPEVNVLPGRGTLIPVRAFRECGLYDESHLPHYGADYEFAARAARSGYRLAVSTSAVLTDTGIAGETRLSPIAWIISFFSRRSPFCLLYRLNFARLAPPPVHVVPFLICDFSRILISQTWLMLKSFIPK